MYLRWTRDTKSKLPTTISTARHIRYEKLQTNVTCVSICVGPGESGVQFLQMPSVMKKQMITCGLFHHGSSAPWFFFEFWLQSWTRRISFSTKVPPKPMQMVLAKPAHDKHYRHWCPHPPNLPRLLVSSTTATTTTSTVWKRGGVLVSKRQCS